MDGSFLPLNFFFKSENVRMSSTRFWPSHFFHFLYDGLYKQKRINAYKPSHKTASDYPFFHEIVLNKYMLFCLNWQAFLINYSKAFINIHFNVIAVNHLRWILYIYALQCNRKYRQNQENTLRVCKIFFPFKYPGIMAQKEPVGGSPSFSAQLKSILCEYRNARAVNAGRRKDSEKEEPQR